MIVVLCDMRGRDDAAILAEALEHARTVESYVKEELRGIRPGPT